MSLALVPSLSENDKFVESNRVHSATRRTLRQESGSVLNHHRVSFQRPLIDRGSFEMVKCVEEGRGKRERSVRYVVWVCRYLKAVRYHMGKEAREYVVLGKRRK